MSCDILPNGPIEPQSKISFSDKSVHERTPLDRYPNVVAPQHMRVSGAAVSLVVAVLTRDLTIFETGIGHLASADL